MTSVLHQLVYCSRNRIGSDHEAQIRDILAGSRQRNARAGITGALLFSAGMFAQALEGPLAAVERTFERIQYDARHDDVLVLACQTVPRRGFAQWSMAYAGPLDAERDATAHLALDRAFRVTPAEAGREVLALLHRVCAGADAVAGSGGPMS